MSEMGTALPGYTPDDLLRIIDVNHLRIAKDSAIVSRRGPTFSAEDNERAAHIVMIPQIKSLMTSPGPSIVAIDGRFDRSQIGKISPLSYMCAMLSQTIRQQSEECTASSPASPQFEMSSRKIVLEYYCSLHTASDDYLSGPQGLMRCLVTQLILSLVANGWMGPDDAVNLPYLRNAMEEDLLRERALEAVCRLFTALTRCVPHGVPVYCFVDSWSAFEREDPWREDYDVVIGTLREVAGANVKVLLTSPTMSRWLVGLLPAEQRVVLRNRDGGGGGNWRGVGRGSLLGVAKAATLTQANGGFGNGFSVEDGRGRGQWMDDGDWRGDGKLEESLLRVGEGTSLADGHSPVSMDSRGQWVDDR